MAPPKLSFPPVLQLMLLLLFAFSLPCFSRAAQYSAVQPRDLWCVAKNNADDQALQSAIDWACGPGGADCRPIQQGGPCYDSTDVQTTASWAFNDYYLKHGLTDDACFFSNSAALTSLNPSHGDCKFPSSSSVNNGSIATTTTVGMGPDIADLSSCNRMPSTWFWPLLAAFFFCPIFMGNSIALASYDLFHSL